MIDMSLPAVRGRLIDYFKQWYKDPATTCIEVKKMDELIAAANAGTIPEGTFLPGLYILQFDGDRNAAGKLLDTLKNDEKILPYGPGPRPYREGLDCAEIPRFVYRMWLGIDIGSWSVGQYNAHKQDAVPWDERRAGDCNYYKTDSKVVGHVSMLLSREYQIETSKKSDPLRVEPSTRNAKIRVATIRYLTDEQYAACLYKKPSEIPVPPRAIYHTVQRGENLYKILAYEKKIYGSLVKGVTVKSIVALNRLPRGGSLIFPEQKIRIL